MEIESQKGKKLVAFLVKELSVLAHGYKSMIVDCYDAAISRSGFIEPPEGKEKIVEATLVLLKQFYSKN